ncbi:MAG: hypothetical protein ABIN58_11655, partial [candidate division WOR-3 bacterium]
MPDITNAQIVRFANERARVFADALEEAYLTAKRLQDEYNALGVTIPDTADLVADGSDVDGRKRITGSHLVAIKSLADALVTYMEAGTPSRISRINQVSVNGRARF